jgi:hypothetical protein
MNANLRQTENNRTEAAEINFLRLAAGTPLRMKE